MRHPLAEAAEENEDGQDPKGPMDIDLRPLQFPEIDGSEHDCAGWPWSNQRETLDTIVAGVDNIHATTGVGVDCPGLIQLPGGTARSAP